MKYLAFTVSKDLYVCFFVFAKMCNEKDYVRTRSISSLSYSSDLQNCPAPGQKQPIRGRRRVLVLSSNLMYALLNVLLAQKWLTVTGKLLICSQWAAKSIISRDAIKVSFSFPLLRINSIFLEKNNNMQTTFKIKVI